MRRLRACLGAAAAVSLAAVGTTALVAGSASGATTALSNRWYAAAPYLMPLDNDPPDAAAIMDATGLKAFQLAFVLAPNGGGCSPTWGGTAAVSSDTAVQSVINTIRAKGGDVSISIGGYGGTKLGQTCSDAASTAAAYQQVITKYGLHAVDFDLEEPEYENTAAIKNEIGAAKILQQNNPGLYVSVTTAGDGGRNGLVRQADAAGGEGAGLHPEQLLHHAVRRRLQRRRVPDRRARQLQHDPPVDLRLGPGDRLRP